jgi:transcriptional regulator with XRE-family HTH domain
MAADLGWQRTKISKIENGRQMPTAADITAWTATCGQPEAEAELLDMLATVRAVHRQHQHQLRGGHAATQADLDRLTQQATRIRNFEVLLIPGLTQTPAYARHIATEISRVYGTDPAGVEGAVAARMRRQEALYDPAKQFEFVLTEAALRFRLVPPEVMRGQLDRLASLSGFSNVKLGVIPMGVETTLTPLHGFLMLDDVTYIETYAAEIVLRGEEAAVYERIMDALLNEAVTGDQARQLLTDATNKL